jgi:flagellar basal-body rod protein FlgC
MSFWSSLKVSSSALSAQQLRLDLISNNIANADSTSSTDGTPYQRQDVVFSTASTNTSDLPDSIAQRLASVMPLSDNSGGVQVSQIITDTTEGEKEYDPENPDADADGYVTNSNVDLVTEMTNMLSATRSYEANLAMIDAAKNMALKALNIGR